MACHNFDLSNYDRTMHKRTIKQLLTISQTIPAVFIIISFVKLIINGYAEPEYLTNLLLFESAFFLPSVFMLFYWLNKQTYWHNQPHMVRKYLVLSYLRGICASILLSLLILLVCDLCNLYPVSFSLTLTVLAVLSPFVSTLVAIK